MTLKRINCLLVGAGILIGSFAGFIGNVFADGDKYEGLDSVMTISPPKQQIVLVPGEDFEGSVSVSCMSTAKNDLKYSVTVGSFNLGKDEDGNIDYNDTDVDTITSFNQIMDWIELKKEGGSVARGETDAIPFVIHVPKDAPAGGQYATIIIQDDTEKEGGEKGNIMIDSRVRFASEIFAEVTGDTDDKGVVLENNIPAFLLSNRLEAEDVLQVWPLFSDEEVCTNEEEPATSLIMPGTERYHAETCDRSLTPGIYRAVQKVKIFGEISEVEKTVIVCPLWLLFVILFAIIALIIWIVMKIRNRNNRNSRTGD